MKKSTDPKIPAHLSDAAKRWWKDITTEYVFEVPDSLMTLQLVCECWDRSELARKIVEKEGVTINDRFGFPKQHPATIVERDSKMAMLRGLRALGLDVVPPGSMAGSRGK